MAVGDGSSGAGMPARWGSGRRRCGEWRGVASAAKPTGGDGIDPPIQIGAEEDERVRVMGGVGVRVVE